MTARPRAGFVAVRSEGSLLPADLLRRIADGDPSLDGLTPLSYRLLEGERLNSLVLDYLCRNAISQPALTIGVLNQLPVLPPSAFSAADIAFIAPRVVELVYTAWDMRAFAADVWSEADASLRALILERWRSNREDATGRCSADMHAPALRASATLQEPPPPFIWHDERRAVARAELDARIARRYGLTRDELRYILDPADVYGPDFPGETFRALKEKEIWKYGEYRSRRLTLEAWDRGGVIA